MLGFVGTSGTIKGDDVTESLDEVASLFRGRSIWDMAWGRRGTPKNARAVWPSMAASTTVDKMGRPLARWAAVASCVRGRGPWRDPRPTRLGSRPVARRRGGLAVTAGNQFTAVQPMVSNIRGCDVIPKSNF